MGDLGIDSAIEGRGGRYCAHLSRDWEAMGPHGGYLSTIALRAAGAESGMARPVSYYCQYLNVAQFAPVDLEVTVLRRSKRTAAVQVAMRQEDRPILQAQVWAVADGLPGLTHEDAPMPDVPQPEEVKRGRDLLAEQGEVDDGAGANMDWRPIGWRRPEEMHLLEPVIRGWTCFEPTRTFDDPFLDAGRLAYVVDTLCFAPAVHRLRVPWEENPFVGPSMDLLVHFHADASDADWLFHEHDSAVAGAGVAHGAGRVWSRDGRLLASGGSQCICVPNPSYTGGGRDR